MEKKVFKNLVSVLAMLGFAVLAAPVLADNVSIENNVSVSAETGGNKGGTVSEGKATTDVRIESEVGGKKQDPVIIHETKVGGKIDREIEVKSEDGVFKTKVKTSAEAEEKIVSNEDKTDEVQTVDSKVTVSTKGSVLASIGNFFAEIGSTIWLSIKSIF